MEPFTVLRDSGQLVSVRENRNDGEKFSGKRWTESGESNLAEQARPIWRTNKTSHKPCFSGHRKQKVALWICCPPIGQNSRLDFFAQLEASIHRAV